MNGEELAMPRMIDWGSLTPTRNIKDKNEHNEAEKYDIKLLESRKNVQSIRGSVMGSNLLSRSQLSCSPAGRPFEARHGRPR